MIYYMQWKMKDLLPKASQVGIIQWKYDLFASRKSCGKSNKLPQVMPLESASSLKMKKICVTEVKVEASD